MMPFFENAGLLPERGLCAHRGAMQLRPENTLAAFREAIRLGAHMIELDIRLSKDGHPVVIHDQTVDRTTNGFGSVSDLSLPELKQLRIRESEGGATGEECIPTLAEVLELMPRNIWLNLHLKGKADRGGMWSRLAPFVFKANHRTDLAKKVTRMLFESDRLHQGFLACGGKHARAARQENENVQVCYLLRGCDSQQAVHEAVAFGAQFIQLSLRRPPTPALVSLLRKKQIRITYGFATSIKEIKALLESGIDFPLVNNIHELMDGAREMGIPPVHHTVGQTQN